jgi:hypothetical protein
MSDKSALTITQLTDKVQYLTDTNKHLVEDYHKLEKKVNELQTLVSSQHAILQFHGLAEYGN